MKSTRLAASGTERGFTLVEILVSLVIILILVMAFVPLFELTAKTVTTNKHKEVATTLANSMIEEMRSMPFIVKDPDTGLLETDPTIPQLGIQNGNPPGSIPAVQTRTIDGVDYTIRTHINWVTLDSNPAAYKKVSVTVESPSLFTGDVTVTSEFHTLAAEEGELNLPQSGHIRVSIKDKNGNLMESPDIEVSIASQTGLIDQTNDTEDGQTLFGVISAGLYTVSALVPDNMSYRPDQPMVDGSLHLGDVEVTDFNTTEVEFFIDSPGKISLTLTDADSDQPISGWGECVLYWTEDGSSTSQRSISFDEGDFVDNHLSSSCIGDLWPGGYYSISLNDILDKNTLRVYSDYDMSASANDPHQLNGEDWDGTFAASDTTLDLSIELDSLLETHLATSGDNKVITDTHENLDNPDEPLLVVLEWVDQSTNGYNAVVPMGANRPLLYNSELNGLPVIRFNGAEQLDINNPDVPTDNFSIIIVAKSDVEHEVDTQSNSSTEGVYNQKYLLWPEHKGSNAGQGVSLGNNGVSNYEHGTNYMPPTAVYIGEMGSFNVIGISYVNKQPYIYLNGFPAANGLTSQRNTVYSPTTIGGDEYGYFNGDIAEILIYDASLSSSHLEYISNELMSKYDL